MLALRYVYVLALVVWLGGMVILGALVAPTLFEVLQSTDPASGRALAGAAFGESVARFHYVAYVAGTLLLMTLTAMRLLGPKPIAFAARALITVVMLGIAIYSGGVILRRIDAIQVAAGTLPSRLPAADPRRIEFDALHVLSERLMMINVVGGLLLLYWEAREHA
jgi:hypothetical protein